jgi:hypothetical protein
VIITSVLCAARTTGAPFFPAQQAHESSPIVPSRPPAARSLEPRKTQQEQEKRQRLRGKEALKSNILAAKTVARTLRSSLGPKGMDKILQSPDGDVTISCVVVAVGMARDSPQARARPPRHC